MFSTRTPSDLAPNRLTSAELAARAGGVRVIDLTETNPTRVGLAYPDRVLAPLAAPEGLGYDPHPFGLPAARETVAAAIGTPGSPVDPSRVVLTASTSEAYAFLFKLLCNPGDEVLVPVPSYPLFEHLTRLELVAVRSLPARLPRHLVDRHARRRVGRHARGRAPSWWSARTTPPGR